MRKITALLAILILSIPCAGISDPVARWKLDETSGLTAYDSAGSNDGTLVGDPNWTTGQVDGALDFDGSDDYVEAVGYKGITGTASRTCAAWIKTPYQLQGKPILSWGDTSLSGGRWFLKVDSTIGTLRVSVGGGNRIGSVAVNDGNWHHVAAVLVDDGSPNSDEIKLYVDGIEDTAATGSPIAISTGNADNVMIGSCVPSSPQFFEGMIDDVRIYDYALNVAEIEQVYFEGADNLWVTPNDDLDSSGNMGGPFVPASKDYQLTNIGETAVSWYVQYSVGWLDVSDTTGVLDPNESVMVTVSINATADTLGGGVYTDTLVFRDTTNPVDIVEYRRDVNLVIGADVPYLYPTIQSAINASGNGDTIIVAPGTYHENINFGGKNIILTSIESDNPATTIINGNDSGSVVTFSGSETISCKLKGFTITNGYTSGNGGGIYGNGTGAAISECIIRGNYAGDSGGGLYFCDGTITNCIIRGNTANEDGGGLYLCDGTITNCTIANNLAGNYGGGLNSCRWGTITNCIIWGNTATADWDQLYCCSVTPYSCVQDWGGGGTGIITSDPLFADPANGNYHLQPDSPCIEKGTDSPPGGLPATDIEGNPRPQDGDYDGQARADMGAYEFTPVNPVIILSANQFDFTAYEYQANPADEILSISNYGGGTLNWIITESCSWLGVTPDSGSTTGEPNDVTISIDIAGLTWGLYFCDLTITDPCAMNSPQIVSVDLDIIGPIIGLSDTSLNFEAEEGGTNPDDQILTITNTGGGILNWLISESCDWLSLSPDSGSSTGEPNEVTLSVDITGFEMGTYNCNLTISDSYAVNNPQTIDVELLVAEISLSPYWKNQIYLPNDPFFVPGTSDADPGWVKFTSILKSGYDPNLVYYQDSIGYPFHYDFATERLDPFIGMTVPEFFDVALYETGQEASLGAVIVPYDPDVLEYGIQLIRYDPYTKEQIVEMFNHIKTTITAPGYTAYYFPTYEQYAEAEANKDWLLAQGVPIGSIAQWIDGNICYSPGWALGELKFFEGNQIQSAYLSGDLSPGDILLTDGIPAEIPNVAGIITLSPTTPNSHVVILAKTYGIPMAYLVIQEDIDTAQQMVGFNIVLCVEENAGVCNVDITDAEAFFTQSEINDMLASKAPGSLNFSAIASYGDYSADANDLVPADIQYFGGKAANYGMLRQSIPDNCPEAIGISFDLWSEFLDQTIVPRASVTIEPNSFELFWADRDIAQGSNHADFKLNDEGEYIGLYDRNGTTLIDGLAFGLQSNDVSYGRSVDGGDTWQFFPGGSATPGQANSPGSSSGSGLVINEFMAENDLFIQDNFGEYDDWFELYNASGIAIDLGGMYLTDDPCDPTDWMIPPAVTGSTLREEIANRLSGYTYPPSDMAALSEDLSAIRSLFKNTYITSFTSAQINAIETVLQNNFDVNEKIRFRSSTNVEDSEEFIGAGLYDSYSGCLADDLDGNEDGPCICDSSETNERGVFRAIRKVFASFYNDNAFLERLKYGVEPNDVGMALLVHHSFPDEFELANGVATLEKSSTGPEKTIKLITQEGATSVANPTDGLMPEEVRVYVNGSGVITLTFISGSNLVILGEKVMDWESDYIELAQLLVDASVEFENQTGKNDYILDFEYKKLDPGGAAIPAGGIAVKQIREIPQPAPADLECPRLVPAEEPTSCLWPCVYDSYAYNEIQYFTDQGVSIYISYFLSWFGGGGTGPGFSHWDFTSITGLTSEPIYLYSCQSQCHSADWHGWCENFYFEPIFEPGISRSILNELWAMDIKGIELYDMPYCGSAEPGIIYHPFDNGPPFTPGDFEPDGDVDLADFGKISQYWQSSNCGSCGGYDLTGDGNIYFDDLVEFANWWLAGS